VNDITADRFALGFTGDGTDGYRVVASGIEQMDAECTAGMHTER